MFKSLVKKRLETFGRRWGYDTRYMQEIVDEAGVGAVLPLQALGKLGSYRKVPAEVYAGATLTASKAADCDRLRSARIKREVYVGPWLPEPVISHRVQNEDPAALQQRARHEAALRSS